MSAATVTLFPDNKGTHILADAPIDLAELERVIREAPPANAKDDLPLLKFAKFTGTFAEGKFSLRSDPSVIEVSGVEGDYDGPTMPMADAVALCAKAGIQALFYESARHEPDRPRWRVLCPLASPLTGTTKELHDRRAHWVGTLNAILGNVLTSESFVLSQCFYYGAITGRPAPKIVRLEGMTIDRMRDPPEPIIVKAAAANGKDTTGIDPTTDEELKQAFTRGDGRYEAMKKLSARWAARGMNSDDIKATLKSLLDTSPEGNANTKNLRKQVAVLARTAVKKFGETRDKVPADPAVLEELNHRHALVWIGGELVVLWRHEWDGAMPRLSRIGHMTQYYRNRVIAKTNPFNAWMDSPSRAEFSKIVFEPGTQRTPGAFNLFNGWGQEPRDGNCSLLLELLRDVWCAGDEGAFAWVQDWFADLYQNPDRKPGTAIATVSKQGGGKNAVFRYVSKTLPRYCTLLAGSDSILGHFNDHLAGRLLIFGDEAVWPRDKRGAAKLKSYITEPEISVERKHVPRVDIANHARFIFATNDDLVAPTELDDRRYTVLRLAEHRVHDRKFWDAFHAELNAGGPAAFAWHCLHRVKLSVDLRRPYETAALAEQKVLNLDHVGAWWLEMLGSDEHEMPDAEHSTPEQIAYLRWSFGTSVLTQTLHRFYLRHAQKMRVHFPASPTELGVALVRRYLPQLAKREVRAAERRHLEVEGRAYVYDMPTVQEAREAFDHKVGRKLPWPPGDEL